MTISMGGVTLHVYGWSVRGSPPTSTLGLWLRFNFTISLGILFPWFHLFFPFYFFPISHGSSFWEKWKLMFAFSAVSIFSIWFSTRFSSLKCMYFYYLCKDHRAWFSNSSVEIHVLQKLQKNTPTAQKWKPLKLLTKNHRNFSNRPKQLSFSTKNALHQHALYVSHSAHGTQQN